MSELASGSSGRAAQVVSGRIGDEPTPAYVGTIWILLMINVLGFIPGEWMVLPIPKSLGQIVTMGALMAAFAMALLRNPRIRMRPNAYLVLLTLLTLVAIISSMALESGLGALLRCFRLTVFVVTLWLICRWWRGDMRIAWFHIRALCLVLLSVVAGLVVAPGSALSGSTGRLAGVLWPIPPPQVGQYCAIAIGLVVLLWMARSIDGRSVALVTVPGIVLLLLTHTRTALLGLIAALAVAALTMALRSARARGAVLVAGTVGGLAAAAFSQAALVWLQRGQDEDELLSLTGRQKVWDALLARDRTVWEQAFGIGLTDKSFDGLPIDSTWLSVYHDLGLAGVAIVVLVLLVLLGTAALRPPTPARACAIFLVVYCIVASYTEVGLGDASPYLLHLAVATSLLLSPPSAALTPGVEPGVGGAPGPRIAGNAGQGSDEIIDVRGVDMEPRTGLFGKGVDPWAK